MENPFKKFGVEPHLFSSICYALSLGERERVNEENGVVGSSYSGQIGVHLTHRNVKDGKGGYCWSYGLLGDGWKIRAAMSIRPPKDGRPYARVIIRSLNEDRPRYVFSVTCEGDENRMKHDLALARLFLD